jgi:hypothetical protein
MTEAKPEIEQKNRIQFRRIRVRKEDSAYVYCILESHEGITSYSTLDHQAGDPFRDLELQIPFDFVDEVNRVLKDLGDMIYELSEDGSN